MTDVVDKYTRSRMMAGIRGKDTRPEKEIRSALHRLGFRFRLHSRQLPGRPDIVLPSYKAAIFVHGCFWHRHEGCRYATNPRSNSEFWKTKFEGNVARDARNVLKLREEGWRVAVVWECGLRSGMVQQAAKRLSDWLRSERKSLVIPGRPRVTVQLSNTRTGLG